MNTRKTARFYATLMLMLFCSLHFGVSAQSNVVNLQPYNPINTAMPSQLISPDARASGMGDVGVATLPDAYSQHWNPAKYPFTNSKSGVAFGYTPWLRDLVKNIYLAHVVGYHHIDTDSKRVVSGSLKYLHIGDISITDATSNTTSNVSPYELSLDVAYSHKVAPNVAIALSLRYLRSDYSYVGNSQVKPTNNLAFDFAGYHQKQLSIAGRDALLGLGINISNVGAKVSADGGNTHAFLPTNLKVGGSLTYSLDTQNSIALSLDANKLLVPTPPIRTLADTSNIYQIRMREYYNTSAFAGIFKSFSDAPGGASEEFKEITWAIGAEYWWQKRFALRTGYFHESSYKGNRQFVSFGTGFKYQAFAVDVSYLVATSKANPLDQTLRLSLGIELDKLSQLF